MVDLFAKLIKGKNIKNKKPTTIIQAIVDSWIIGYGAGPSHPTHGFWPHNGGEFLNLEMINIAAACDIDIKMSAAESPWQNVIVERNHATWCMTNLGLTILHYHTRKQSIMLLSPKKI